MEYKLEPSYRISFRYRKILVPFDGSGPSMSALELALDWSLRYGSSVTVAIALPIGRDDRGEHSSMLEQKAREVANSFGKEVSIKKLHFDPLKESQASVLVKEALEGGYDVIIMGARGTTPSEDINLGSVALSLIHNTIATLVIVR